MKVYIDFDGVILDTDSVIDSDYDGTISRRDFVRNYDWFKLMRDDLIINDSLYNIINSRFDVYILSKISSMCEGQAKVRYLRSKKVNIDIHLVPTMVDKCDIVSACGNILVDDKIFNLDSWSERGGISIFFNKDGNCFDVNGCENTLYPMISDLRCLVQGFDDLKKNN
jgi:hypothetical protein